MTNQRVWPSSNLVVRVTEDGKLSLSLDDGRGENGFTLELGLHTAEEMIALLQEGVRRLRRSDDESS